MASWSARPGTSPTRSLESSLTSLVPTGGIDDPHQLVQLLTRMASSQRRSRSSSWATSSRPASSSSAGPLIHPREFIGTPSLVLVVNQVLLVKPGWFRGRARYPNSGCPRTSELGRTRPLAGEWTAARPCERQGPTREAQWSTRRTHLI